MWGVRAGPRVRGAVVAWFPGGVFSSLSGGFVGWMFVLGVRHGGVSYEDPLGCGMCGLGLG